MRAIGVILAGGNNNRLGDLTALRATSAIPVGGSYRCIDFPLSNMSNSGINKVAVITQYNSRSLHDHLSSSKWWDLGRKQGGLFVFSPYISRENNFWFRGTADSIYQNMNFLARSHEEYVVIASGNTINKMNYNDMLRYHIDNQADVTIAYQELNDREEIKQFGVMMLDGDNRVTDFEEKPLEAQSNKASMGVYIFERKRLMKLLQNLNAEGRHDITRDIIMRHRKQLKIFGYRHEGYWRTLNSVKNYFDCNMEFLNHDVRSLFTGYPHTQTKPKDEAPAKYNAAACVRNSLIGSGSILSGRVENSVLFRRVHTADDSIIKNSIIMEGTYVGNGVTLENVILDKDIVIPDGKQLKGEPNRPLVISKSALH